MSSDEQVVAADRFADPLKLCSNPDLRGYQCIVTSKFGPYRSLIQNWCEVIIEPAQGGKNGQHGLGRCRFDDQPVAFLAHDGVLAGQFELPRTPHSPVSPILKDL